MSREEYRRFRLAVLFWAVGCFAFIAAVIIWMEAGR